MTEALKKQPLGSQLWLSKLPLQALDPTDQILQRTRLHGRDHDKIHTKDIGICVLKALLVRVFHNADTLVNCHDQIGLKA